jgi:murein tripeptide amidase MpaA
MSKLCDSLGGLEVPLLIVHETHKEKTESTANSEEEGGVMKRCVIVCGRAHPGESNGSYMVEGFLDFICGDSKMAEFLRRHVIFKIVPMINPDGVALGNYRTGLSGRDFNREYRDPDK